MLRTFASVDLSISTHDICCNIPNFSSNLSLETPEIANEGMNVGRHAIPEFQCDGDLCIPCFINKTDDLYY